MKVVITGADGQLGTEFKKEFLRRNVPFFGTDISICDITKPASVDVLLDAHKPTVLINCAAYNLVDEAETKCDLAYAVNAQAVKVLASACQVRHVKFVHYSTDYVFDGRKGDVYAENDEPHPLNVYGLSKYEGETLARSFVADHLVFRTSWVYGEGQQNFLYKLKQWASKNKVLQISEDEVSVPTSVEDLVQVTLAALENGVKGMYHLTSSGYASRYEWARYFFQDSGVDVEVVPVPMASFQLKAVRPSFSAMSNRKISEILGITIPAWQEGVDKYLRMKRE
ncbi:MAG: dTDP-4-dehydrorhamnose reductase [Candidatus Omnitrophica bacterium]|nr:dTDP-4-dehydrorhamnose reductase [Candidatus Omnitrophota bacterium]